MIHTYHLGLDPSRLYRGCLQEIAVKQLYYSNEEYPLISASEITVEFGFSYYPK